MPTTRSSNIYELPQRKEAIAVNPDPSTDNADPRLTLRGENVPPKPLPSTLTSKNTGLSTRDQKLLHTKQRRLQLQAIARHDQKSTTSRVTEASLVFAQEAAGTAICISPDGLLLTCSHCVAESRAELQDELQTSGSITRWLLFASGRIVQAELVPRAWDERRDLALLKIVAAQPDPADPSPNDLAAEAPVPSEFPYVQLANSPPKPNTPLLCVGHPGSEDLEASTPGLATGYDVLHISSGRFRGYADGQDLQDNSEIGALKHDCWTYWGHSGAPLVQQKTGRLVGLHSSWDSDTGMRRGVPLEAMQQFLGVWTVLDVD